MNRKKFKQVSLVTGGFDPLHSGHISYFKSAKELSSHLVVGINSDDSARGAIRKCLELADKVVFCNGGDRRRENIPETMGFANNENVIFEYSIGGNNKMNSSSWILQEYFDRQRKLLGI